MSLKLQSVKDLFKSHIVVVADSEIVCRIKFCREDRTVINVGELCLAEEWSLEENQPVSSQQFRVVTQLLSLWKLGRERE